MSELEEQLIELLNAEVIFLRQQLAEVTQEREQCVRDMSGWMDNGETLSQAICAMRLSASTFKQQLAAMTEKGKPLPYPLDECAGCRDLTQQLAEAIAERDASQEIVRKIAAGMAPMEALVSGMGMVIKLEQQLATMTEERDQWKQGHNDAVRVGLEYQQQLATMTEEREEARDMAACLLFFGPTFPADVAWAEMQIAKMKHQAGLL